MTDANRYDYPPEAIRILHDEIRSKGLGPCTCPDCGCETLYPPGSEARLNDNTNLQGPICVLCGIRISATAAGMLEKTNDVIAETMRRRVEFFEDRRKRGGR